MMVVCKGDVRRFGSKAGGAKPLIAVFVVLGVLLGACAAIQNQKAISTERLLSAAGFQMKLADTPDKLVKLTEKPQRILVPVQGQDGNPFFMYADATECKCMYVGTQDAYQRYQKLVVQQQIAEDQVMAAQMNQSASMDWGMWGPWGPWW